jgi:hypothetical protein
MGYVVPKVFWAPAREVEMRVRLILVGLALAAASVAGCAGRDDPEVPFYPAEADTETETEAETESHADTDNGCPPDYTDQLGRCIRYVRFDSESDDDCGFTWQTAFDDLQEGIEAAYDAAQVLGSCSVWVANGTYRAWEGDPLDTFKLHPHVDAYGGFAGDEQYLYQRDPETHPTVLEGRQQGGNGRVYHVVMGASDSRLDGFVVRGGNAVGESPHHRGGGIYLNAASTSIANCELVDNAAYEGGAVFVYDSTPSFVATTFSGNRSERGGAVYVLNGLPVFEETVFVDNRAGEHGGALYLEKMYSACLPIFLDTEIRQNEALGEGGGLFNNGCSPEIHDSMVEENSAQASGGGIVTYRGELVMADTAVSGNSSELNGGGMFVRFTDLELSRCSIESNRAELDGGGAMIELTEGSLSACDLSANLAGRNGGGVAVSYGGPRLFSTLVVGNVATSGGGMYDGTRAEPRLINTVFNGNLAQQGGGIYNAELAEPEVTNCILWGDEGGEIHDEIGSEPVVSYSDVGGGYPGQGNIDQQPLFVDSGHWDDGGTPYDASDDKWVDGDYRLQQLSPCIDVGDEEAAPMHDADGNCWTDLEGTGNPGVTADIGAYDYRP